MFSGVPTGVETDWESWPLKLMKILNGENPPEEMQLDYVGASKEMGEGLMDTVGCFGGLCG